MCLVLFPRPVSIKQSILNAQKMYNIKYPTTSERLLDRIDKLLRKRYYSDRGTDRRVHAIPMIMFADGYEGPDRRHRRVYEDNE